MTTDRITITLPKALSARVRERARELKKPVSRVIAEDLETAERERVRQLLIEGYKAIAADPETRRVTAEFEATIAEDWPE